MVKEITKPKWNDLGVLERNHKLKRNIKWLESSKLKRHIKEDFETIEELAILLFFYRVPVYTPRGFTATGKYRFKSIEGAYFTVKTYFKEATVFDLIQIKNNLMDMELINHQWCSTVRKYTHFNMSSSYLSGHYFYWAERTFSEIFEIYKDNYELLKLEKL